MRSVRILFLLALPAAAAIEQIDVITTSHTDVGFTDQPSITRELQKRYLDIALDACLRTAHLPPGERFYWTAEATLSVMDWWNDATPERRRQLLQAVKSGQLDIAALSCNNTPFMNREEWATAVRWLPDDLWQRVSPLVALQDDVNGLPRAGALALLDRGIHRVHMGINVDSGGRPFRAPDAFWWKMPDGRRVLVYLGEHYGSGYHYFEATPWIMGPSARAGNGLLRPPRAGEIFRTDEASVRAAHRRCLDRLTKLQADGYRLPRLIVSVTNQWRWDNDPPFPPLAEFIAVWNRLNLKPALRFTTASVALADIEQMSGATLPVYEGEWTDYWANGTASAPREVAASRLAKRFLRAAESEVWGSADAAVKKQAGQILRDLVLFDEHTWGSADSISLPDSLDTAGQFTEKSALAYMPMARAEFLLATRLHTRLDSEPEGFYVVNTAPRAASGWVRFPKRTRAGEVRGLEEAATGKPVPVYFERSSDRLLASQVPGPADAPPPVEAPVAKFWVENLAPKSILRLRFGSRAAEPHAPAQRAIVTTDENGWPKSVSWAGMSKPLFLAGFGDFLAVKANAPRSTVANLAAGNGTAEERLKILEEVPATAALPAEVEQTAHTTVYTQALTHPRLKYLIRRLELWDGEPRARLTVRLYRISSTAPESFYVNFPLPAPGVLPVLSSGGVPFVPIRDQLGDSCRDYYALDGWAHYRTGAGDWLWVTRDAAMVTIGGPNTLARIKKEAPAQPNRLMAMLFNNHWHTNFVADEHGAMEFQFDLVWKEKIEDPEALAETLTAEPVVLLNPAAQPDPLYQKDLWRP
jgi:Glycosyl hydrolases family 38 N-terminal domain